MIRTLLVSVVALGAISGCSGATVNLGAGEGGTDGGSHAEDAGPPTDTSPAMDGGPSTCKGTAPNCFGDDDSTCCGQDPAGIATCVDGAWMCGSAKAPGCNGKSCLLPEDAGMGPDTGPTDGGPEDVGLTCTGPNPNCYGMSDKTCCVLPLHDPLGPAKCVGTTWMCGPADAPGCDLHCTALDAGPPLDVVAIDASAPPPPPSP